jgi:exo-1,4-beta-D-glucosaminidase
MSSSPGRLRRAVLRAGATALLLSLGAAGPAAAHDRSAAGPPSELTRGWSIQSSAVATQPGSVISRPGYSTRGWLPLSQPETLMAGLVENGRYPDVLKSDNLAKVPTEQFDVNWWYRDEVRLHPRRGQHVFLTFHGVLSRANLWVNGRKVADQSQLQGAYSELEYDITDVVRDGENAIALDVYKNDSSEDGYLTMNMVDWNPPSPDGWTGLQFAPTLAVDGAVSLRDAHVLQHDAPDVSSADLTLKADVRNNTSSPQRVVVGGTIAGHGRTRRARRPSRCPPARPRPSPCQACTSTTRRCGGPTRWATSRSTTSPWPRPRATAGRTSPPTTSGSAASRPR